MNVQHRPHGAVIAALGVLLAVTGWLAGSAAGFVSAPLMWGLCAVWLAALGVPYLAGRRCAAQPAALADQCKPLGAAMAACAVLLLANGFMNLPDALAVVRYGYAFGATKPAFALVLDAATPIFSALWLTVYAVRACTGYGVARGKPGSAAVGLVMPLYFLWRLFWQFQVDPAALPRVQYTLTVLGSVAALLFAAALLKVFLTPGQSCGHTLFGAGVGCFLLCSCAGTVQTLRQLSALTAAEVYGNLALSALGVCGLVCAVAACGKETE